MFEQFVDLKYLVSFPGMIAVVIMLTQFTKKLFDLMLPNKTKYVAYGWTIVLTALAAAILGDWTNPIPTVIVWLINSVIVWFASMKAFETIAEAVPRG